jgi:hypothetical protein
MGRFTRCLQAAGGRVVDVESLRELAWSGAPSCYRIATWQTLLGYLPPNRDRQASSIAKKKLEYQQCVVQYFVGTGGAAAAAAAASAAAASGSGAGIGAGLHRSDAELALLRQVLVDVPRTNPGIALFRSDFVQRSLERVLYVWAMRHPASGYVQVRGAGRGCRSHRWGVAVT